MVSRSERVYTARPFALPGPMEASKIREEVTALQARFDALRGYL